MVSLSRNFEYSGKELGLFRYFFPHWTKKSHFSQFAPSEMFSLCAKEAIKCGLENKVFIASLSRCLLAFDAFDPNYGIYRGTPEWDNLINDSITEDWLSWEKE